MKCHHQSQNRAALPTTHEGRLRAHSSWVIIGAEAPPNSQQNLIWSVPSFIGHPQRFIGWGGSQSLWQEMRELNRKLGFLWSRGENDRCGQAVHAQCWDLDLIASVGGELEGELGRATWSDWTERAPEVNSWWQRTRCQQHWSQGMRGDDCGC